MIVQQGEGCYTLLYSPANSTFINTLVTDLRADNTPPIPAKQIRAFESAAQVSIQIPILIDYNNEYKEKLQSCTTANGQLFCR